MLRDLAKVEAIRIYAQNVGPSMIKAAEDALLDILQFDFKSANNGLRNALLHFTKTVLMEMAHDGSLDDFFKQKIENWTYLSMSMDSFA